MPRCSGGWEVPVVTRWKERVWELGWRESIESTEGRAGPVCVCGEVGVTDICSTKEQS